MRLTEPQKRIQAERNKYILKLYNQGLGYKDIATKITEKYGTKISRQRVEQIVKGV